MRDVLKVSARCPVCGQIGLVAMDGEYRMDPPPTVPGGPIVIHDAAWSHCDSCAEDILSSALDAAIDDERRRRLGLLRPEEIRDIRERIGLSIADMGDLLCLDGHVYLRLENGRSLPTKRTDELIRQLDKARDFKNRAHGTND